MPCALEALVGDHALMRRLAARSPSVRAVALDSSLSLVPMTDELFDALAGDGGDTHDEVFAKFPPGLDEVLSELSATSPVAYIEVNYFGGLGSQAAALWDRGALRYAPERLDDDVVDARPLHERPVNHALRRLGVGVAAGELDEWDTVRLGRYPDTDDWLDPAEDVRATG